MKRTPKVKPVRCWAIYIPSYGHPDYSHAPTRFYIAYDAKLTAEQKRYSDERIVPGRFVPDPPKKKGRGGR